MGGPREESRKVPSTERQIVALLQEGDAGTPVADLTLKHAAIKDVLSRNLERARASSGYRSAADGASAVNLPH